MPGLKTRYEVCGGSYTLRMDRLMENRNLHRKLFAKSFEGRNLDQLKTALASGDLYGAFEAAHTLKGVAGNLGLTPLCDAVRMFLKEPLQRSALEAVCPDVSRAGAIQNGFERAAALQRRLEGGEPG